MTYNFKNALDKIKSDSAKQLAKTINKESQKQNFLKFLAADGLTLDNNNKIVPINGGV